MQKTKPKPKQPPNAADKITVLEAITTPLGFFVLALLIVEGFLGTVLVWASLDPKDKITGMWLGVGMFVLVVVIVAILDWFRPSHLTFDRDAHLLDRGITPWGTDQDRVKPDTALEGKKGQEV